jgi:hypothetical protein
MGVRVSALQGMHAPPIARLRYGASLCWRAALLPSAFIRFNTGCDFLVRVPRNAFTVLSPSGAVADCIPPPPTHPSFHDCSPGNVVAAALFPAAAMFNHRCYRDQSL